MPHGAYPYLSIAPRETALARRTLQQSALLENLYQREQTLSSNLHCPAKYNPHNDRQLRTALFLQAV